MTEAPDPITWDVVKDGAGGVLWRCCCGRASGAAHTKAEAERRLLAQLKVMNQPEPSALLEHGDVDLALQSQGQEEIPQVDVVHPDAAEGRV